MSRKHFERFTGFDIRGDVLFVDGVSGSKTLALSCDIQDALPLIGKIMERLAQRNSEGATVIPFPEILRAHAADSA